VGAYDKLLLLDNTYPFGFNPNGAKLLPARRALWNHIVRGIVYFHAFKIKNTHRITPLLLFGFCLLGIFYWYIQASSLRIVLYLDCSWCWPIIVRNSENIGHMVSFLSMPCYYNALFGFLKRRF
jgi:hypothetical protein